MKPIQDSVINLYACVNIPTQNLNARISCKNLFKNAITQQFKTPPVNLSPHKYKQHLHVCVWLCLLREEEGRKIIVQASAQVSITLSLYFSQECRKNDKVNKVPLRCMHGTRDGLIGCACTYVFKLDYYYFIFKLRMLFLTRLCWYRRICQKGPAFNEWESAAVVKGGILFTFEGDGLASLLWVHYLAAVNSAFIVFISLLLSS